MESDDRIDFSALDPTRDAERFDRVVAQITRAVAPSLATRQRPRSAVELIAAWRRPMLAAAAVVALLAATVLLWVPARTQAPRYPSGLVGALGVPSPVADWVTSGQAPGPAQLLAWSSEAR